MTEFYGPKESQAHVDSQKVAQLSEEESRALKERMIAFDKMMADKILAKYKLEIQFGIGRTGAGFKHFPGILSIYLSGTKLNGGGDEKIYMCPTEGCRGIIDPRHRLESVLLCTACGQLLDEEKLIGEKLFRLTPQDWAHVILKHFVILGHDADIYLKHHRTDIRKQTALEIEKPRQGEQVNKSRQNRGLSIYPLKHIIADTKNGADLYKQFLAFIKA
jgi:hypothetical protein